jgi:geranylgeranyl pyrophosphate synthase
MKPEGAESVADAERGRKAAETAYRRRLALINGGLDAVLPGESVEPKRLHQAMRHAVFAGGGGKRLRPVVLVTVAADLGLPEEKALPVALALELLHTYSLVHDDLPCMDNAAFRRGAPSVHVQFGYADAVLAGDALLTFVFEMLGRDANSGLVRAGELIVDLALAAGSVGMVGGQQADLDGTFAVAARLGKGGEHPVLSIHRLKTAKLFRFAFSAPGYLNAGRPGGKIGSHLTSGQGGPERLIESLKAAGESFGLAFQVADDIRDVEEDSRAPNYARAVGVEKARQVALDHASQCWERISALFDGKGETLDLVRGAVREMGLQPGLHAAHDD